MKDAPVITPRLMTDRSTGSPGGGSLAFCSNSSRFPPAAIAESEGRADASMKSEAIPSWGSALRPGRAPFLGDDRKVHHASRLEA